MNPSHPTLRGVVLDTTEARRLGEFYRELLGYEYRPGDEKPPAGEPDPKGDDWLVLSDPDRSIKIAIQRVDELTPTTWPSQEVPMQLHLDLTVPTVDDLVAQHVRAIELGATVLMDRFDDPVEPLYVFADPAGHPFCIFVEPSQTAT